MTPRSRQYLELLNEVEWKRVTSGLSRPDQVAFAARLDRLWNELDEAEQEIVERELQALDAKEDAEKLTDDLDEEGSKHRPRGAAA